MRHLVLAAWVLGVLASCNLWAAPVFPELAGRVVDNAGLIDPAAERRIGQMLAAHEKDTTNQVVVVTLENLQGYTIETFGYQLGREWGIGQKGKDNGILLIVAKSERKVRIEVGYGLEGAMTDALASTIIHSDILPAFRKGDFSGGIERGVKAILAVLSGDYSPPNRVAQELGSDFNKFWLLILFIICFWPFVFAFLPASWTHSGRMGGAGRFGGGFGGGGFGGGGFSGGGGGGGFGGGGASGGW